MAGEGGWLTAHQPTIKPSNALIFVHSSTGWAAVVMAATDAAAKLPPCATAVATKTLATTAMVGAQTTNNNQLKA